MNITTMSSRSFNQDVGKAKRAASKGPVFITDRGHLSHVLLTIETYQQITDKSASIVELLSMPNNTDIEFEPVRLSHKLYRHTDLS